MYIDVSKHQGAIDWKKVKAADVDGVFIRAGYGKFATQEDAKFKLNIEGAYNAGIKNIGIYWYSYATSTSQAVQESAACLAVIKPYKDKITMPVYFDQEYEAGILALDNATRTAICNAFCAEIKKAGYGFGVYASEDWFKNKINFKSIMSGAKIWCAKYSNSAPIFSYDVWQYSSSGKIDGIAGNVDLDKVKISSAAWVKTSDGWTYGDKKSEWIEYKKRFYYMNKNGIAVTGWNKINDVWYYFVTASDAKVSGFPECSCMTIK